MTMHCGRKWVITDPVTPELLDEITQAVALNLKINSCCFAIMGHADTVVYWLMNLAARPRDQWAAAIDKEAAGCPSPEHFKQICDHVITHLELP